MFYLTGERYDIKGGAFLGNPYFGYDMPGGVQRLGFICDEGWYAADEIIYNGERWWGLCDDEYRFFYVPDTDVEFNNYRFNHFTM